MSLFPDGERWAEVALGLADGIQTGRYAAGECLGTVKELGVTCIADRPEMRRAVRAVKQGYVVKRGRWHVAGDPPRRPAVAADWPRTA